MTDIAIDLQHITRAEQSLRELPFFARLGADGKTPNVLLDTLENLTLPAPLAFQLTIACEVQPASETI